MGTLIQFPTATSWEPWVSTDVIARHLGVSTRTLHRYRQAGLPHVRHPSGMRYKLSEVDEWVAQHAAVAS